MIRPGLVHWNAPRVRTLAAVILVGLGMSCAGPASDRVVPSVSTYPSSQAGVVDCPDIDLRSPAGDRIDLTGTWVTEREGTRGGIYYLHQTGACVWFAGGFDAPGEELGSLGFLTVVFRGLAGSDFVVTGDWVDVRIEPPGTLGSGGSMTLQIQFGQEPGDLRLVYVGGSGQPFVEPGYREEQSWVKISNQGAYPPPSPGS